MDAILELKILLEKPYAELSIATLVFAIFGFGIVFGAVLSQISYPIGFTGQPTQDVSFQTPCLGNQNISNLTLKQKIDAIRCLDFEIHQYSVQIEELEKKDQCS